MWAFSRQSPSARPPRPRASGDSLDRLAVAKGRGRGSGRLPRQAGSSRTRGGTSYGQRAARRKRPRPRVSASTRPRTRLTEPKTRRTCPQNASTECKCPLRRRGLSVGLTGVMRVRAAVVEIAQHLIDYRVERERKPRADAARLERRPKLPMRADRWGSGPARAARRELVAGSRAADGPPD